MLDKKYFQLKRARTCKNVQERAKPKMNVVSLHCLKIRAQYQNDMAEKPVRRHIHPTHKRNRKGMCLQRTRTPQQDLHQRVPA